MQSGVSTTIKFALLALLMGVAVAFIWEAPHPFELYRTQALPNFPLETLEGKTINTKDWNNYRPRAYNIFASWCGPCRKEMPQIKALNALIPVYGIAVQDSVPNLRKMLQEEGNPFTEIGRDLRDSSGILLGIRGLPTTIILDKYGQIAEVYEGPISPTMLEKQIKPLLERL